MNDRDSRHTQTNRQVSRAAVLVYLIGAAVLIYYLYQLRILEPLEMETFRFQYFPIPRFTQIGEIVFLVLVTGIASWHMGRAVSPQAEQSSGRARRAFQFGFGLLLLATPFLFRLVAQYIASVLRGG